MILHKKGILYIQYHDTVLPKEWFAGAPENGKIPTANMFD